jgi:uncharacterized protein YggU (UPF0235/DUF167 family)
MAGDPRIRLAIRLVPRASVDRVDGVVGGVLRCRVTAPPVAGAANTALERLLASTLGLPRSAVEIVGGQTARTKVVAVDIGRERLLARWPDLAV